MLLPFSCWYFHALSEGSVRYLGHSGEFVFSPGCCLGNAALPGRTSHTEWLRSVGRKGTYVRLCNGGHDRRSLSSLKSAPLVVQTRWNKWAANEGDRYLIRRHGTRLKNVETV